MVKSLSAFDYWKSNFVLLGSEQPISNPLLWDHTKLVYCKCAEGASNANFSRQLLKAIGKVNGLVTSDKEVRAS
jgi:hypothetical protein